MQHGGKLETRVTSTKMQRSPIEQGGLEIPLMVIASGDNQRHVDIFKSFVFDQYCSMNTLMHQSNADSEPDISDKPVNEVVSDSKEESLSIVKVKRLCVVVISDTDSE